MLLKNGTDPDIFTAIRLGKHKQVIRLIDGDEMQVNIRDNDNCTPLHIAGQYGHIDLVKFLIDRGAAPNARNLAGSTPLHNAVYESHTSIIELLLDRGAKVNARDNEGNTPLDAAVNSRAESGEIIELLLSRGADINTRNNMGLTPLHEAAFACRVDLMELLLTHGADINAGDMWGGTPLGMAVGRGFEDGAEYLLKKRAKCDIFSAARLGLIDEMAARIGENPTILNKKDRHGRTLLLLALRQKPWQWEAATFLLEQGAEMDIFTTAMIGDHEKLMALLDKNSNLVNAYDNDRTPLHFAAERGHRILSKSFVNAVRMLIQALTGILLPLCFCDQQILTSTGTGRTPRCI